MLTIYIQGVDKLPENLEVVWDVEKEFNFIDLKETSETRKIIETIEKGKWLDTESYIDRFGFKLWMDNMSTGCKAGLVAASTPNKIINLRECGYNARDSILQILKNGHLMIDFDDTCITPLNPVFNSKGFMKDIPIEIINGDYKFKSLDRLNEYLMYEKFTGADLSKPGIEKIK